MQTRARLDKQHLRWYALALMFLFSIHSTAEARTKHKHTYHAETGGTLIKVIPNLWAPLGLLPNLAEGIWSEVTATSRPSPLLKPELQISTTNNTTSCNVFVFMPSSVQTDDACLPSIEMFFSPSSVTLILNNGAIVRHIYTDGRMHPSDFIATNAGHSIGHWEDKTLVVDTIGLKSDIQAVAGASIDGPIHVVERMYLTRPDMLKIDTTIEAPSILSAPWQYSTLYQRHLL